MFITVKEAAEKWRVSERRVRTLCAQGKIAGAQRRGRAWMIPSDAGKPADGRFRSKESVLAQIDRKKAELDAARPLTEGELERLNEEFAVEYTYNSNAIEGNTLTLRETDLVLRGLTIDRKPLKDHLEAVGHKEAFENANISRAVVNLTVSRGIITMTGNKLHTPDFVPENDEAFNANIEAVKNILAEKY